MAKPAKGGAGDSKQGLIITLVFFVLLAIGLGVSTYYGFAGQKDLEDKAKKADTEKKSMQSDRDWYKFQALMARAYIGAPLTKTEEADLPTLRGTYESGGLGKESGGVEEVGKMTKPLDENPLVGWDPATKKVRGSLLGLVQKLTTEYTALNNAQIALTTQHNEARAAADRRRDAYEKQLAQYKKDNDDLNAKLLEYEKSKSKEFVDLVAKNDDLQKSIDEMTKKFNNAKDEWEKKEKSLNNDKLQKDEKYQKLEQQLPREDVLAHEAPRGKIVSLDRRGEYVFINLGSSDHVKPQLTFSVFGPSGAGKAEGKNRKARLEVIDVIDAHLSRAKVTDVTDPNRNPVVSGDLLFNPAWSPSLKQHIAIAGLIDLTGDGTDSSEEFMRNLQKQNIVVDAYLDLKTLQLRGKLGFNTSYLVIGEMPGSEDVTNPLKENDPRNARVREVQVKLSEVQAEAIKYGIAVVPARRFMSMIGYQVPKNVVPPDYIIRGQRPTKPAGENGDKKPDAEPAKKDEAKDEKGSGR